MAAVAGNRMNLAALQRRDPFITDIVDTASQVALYTFSSKANEWERTDVEGTLFVYTRSASPINGFMILNRLGLNDLIEPINRNLEFQLQDPFLLYKNAQAVIQGIWFYDKDECARIGQLMNSLVQVAIETLQEKKGGASGARQRRASESDTMIERTDLAVMANNPKRNVDIMEMLSKAQDEYDKYQGKRPEGSHDRRSSPRMNGDGRPIRGKGRSRKAEPKPMIDNPNAAATKSTTLPKPTALKVGGSDDGVQDGASAGATMALLPVNPSTQINLATLFQNVQAAQGMRTEPPKPSPPRRSVSTVTTTSGGSGNSQMHPMLKRLMSNPANTLEEIERQQRVEATAEVSAPFSIPEHSRAGTQNGVGAGWPLVEPDSPNTAIKRSLNILPSTPNKGLTPSQSAPVVGGVSAVMAPSTPGGSTISSSSQSSTGGVVFSLNDFADNQRTVNPAQQAAGSRGLQPMAMFPSVKPPLPQGGRQSADLLATPVKVSKAENPVSRGTTLITPHDLVGGASLPATGKVGAMSQAANVLLSPMAFQVGSSSRVTPPITTTSLGVPTAQQQSSALSDTGSTHSSSPQQEAPPGEWSQITPLTKEQLKQSLVYLIRNDTGFLNSIHEAYIRSLQTELAFKLEKL